MRAIIRLTSVLLVLFSVIFLQGCRNFQSAYQLEYQPAPAIKKEGFPTNNPVFIRNIADRREPTEVIPLDPDANPLILIPLWPYTHSETSPILRYTYLQANMLDTVKDIMAQDIQSAGIFNYVTVESSGSIEIRQTGKTQTPSNTYVIQIYLLKATWSRYLTSYGLSYPGTILWAFGLPVSYGNVSVSVKVDIYSPGNSEKPLVGKIITKETSCTEWIYDQMNYNPPISEFAVAELFPQIMAEIRNSATEAVEKYNKTKN